MNGLHAGFSEVDITPTPRAAACEKACAPPAVGVHSPLRARVAVFDDGRRRAAIVVLDLTLVLPETTARLRAELAAAGDLAPGDILISCTHTHSGPLTWSDGSEGEPDLAYLELVGSALVEAMAAAVAGLEPVELRCGRAATERLTFNRRSMYVGDEVATYGPRSVADFVAPEGPADEELQLVLAVRADGSIAGGLVSFACHPGVTAYEPLWSSDFVGELAERLARQHGGTFLYLQGAAGNLDWTDLSMPPAWWFAGPNAQSGASAVRGARPEALQHLDRLAQALVTASEAARRSSRPVEGGDVRVVSRVLEIDRRWPTREQKELAEWFLAQDPDGVDLDDFNRRSAGHSFTFYENEAPVQAIFARDTVRLWEQQRGSGLRPPVDRAEVQVVAIGDLAFVAYPGEMFTEFGLRTKAESPFDNTIVCGIANGYVGYVPTLDAFERGGYETRLQRFSRLVPEAGDTIAATGLELLHELR